MSEVRWLRKVALGRSPKWRLRVKRITERYTVIYAGPWWLSFWRTNDDK